MDDNEIGSTAHGRDEPESERQDCSASEHTDGSDCCSAAPQRPWLKATTFALVMLTAVAVGAYSLTTGRQANSAAVTTAGVGGAPADSSVASTAPDLPPCMQGMDAPDALPPECRAALGRSDADLPPCMRAAAAAAEQKHAAAECGQAQEAAATAPSCCGGSASPSPLCGG